MKRDDPKIQRLRALGALNPHPERVGAPHFQDGNFFDSHDLVQVKYEMLRLVRTEGVSKTDSAALFGLSRPSYYQAESAFAEEGLQGLLPKVRGPKGAHKLNAALMEFIENHIDTSGSIGARGLAQLIYTELGISIHPRSIERAIARKKKHSVKR